MQSRPLVIGTRGSPLALAQARQLQEALIARHGLSEEAVELRKIRTSGDRTDKALRTAGGKGLFTKEIEEALLAGEVDFAVHSMKDLPSALPAGLVIAGLLPREDVRDAFLSPKAARLADLPQGAVLGTSSLRRRAQVRRLRPDIAVVDFRGNVETRLRKLAEGAADATLLAMAGLRRLGMAERVTAAIGPDEILPAIAQGAVGVEIREGDERAAELLAPINDRPTALRVAAERAFLARLGASCNTPVAGLAELDGDRLRLRAQILRPDGSEAHGTEREGPAGDGAAMGDDAGAELLSRIGPGFFEEAG